MLSLSSCWLNQKSPPCGVSKSRGATPAIVVATSANRIGLPTMFGSERYRSCQTRYEITTTGGAGGSAAGGGACPAGACGGDCGGAGGTKFCRVNPPSVIGKPNNSKNPSVTP